MPRALAAEVVAGDFFGGEIPSGGDAHLLKHVLHDWDDDECTEILTCCRRAMTRAARLLVIEMVVDPGPQCSYPKYLDLEMLVAYTGRERTVGEYRGLLERSGFGVHAIRPTDALVSVIEGRAL